MLLFNTSGLGNQLKNLVWLGSWLSRQGVWRVMELGMASSPAGTVESHVANQQEPKKSEFCIWFLSWLYAFHIQTAEQNSLSVHRYSIYLGTISLLHFSLAAAFIRSVIFAVLEIKLSSADTIFEQSIYYKTLFWVRGEDGCESAALSCREEEKCCALLSWPHLQHRDWSNLLIFEYITCLLGCSSDWLGESYLVFLKFSRVSFPIPPLLSNWTSLWMWAASEETR